LASFSLAQLQATPSIFTKAGVETDLERLERVLSRMEADVQAAFARFLREATDPDVIAAVADKLERGDIQGALDLIEPFIDSFANVLPKIFIDAADSETDSLVGQIKPLRATIGVSFDPTNPLAADLMRKNRLEFIQAFTDEQRAATREALASGFEIGQGYAGMARSFRDSIGLSPGQIRWAANYRRLLEQGSRQALDRALRDMRHDGAVERAFDAGKPLDAERIDAMVASYQRNALAFRANTIARTEAVRTLSEAQDESFRQVQRLAQLPDDRVIQDWHTTMDGRERFTHGVMNGQSRPLGVPFDSPSGAQLRYPGDGLAPIEETANCRCRRTFRVLSP
jgi:hypothetical protein